MDGQRDGRGREEETGRRLRVGWRDEGIDGGGKG
jgi:hypothetical protein